MKNHVRREEKRLQRVFHRALLVALATPMLAPLACSSPGSAAGATGGGGAPSGTGGMPGSSGPAPSDAVASSSSTAASSSSSGGAGLRDAGPDAPVAEDGGAGASCAPYAFTPSPPDTCGNYVRLPCGLPAEITPGANCFLYISDCATFCPATYFNCHAADESCTDAGTIVNDSKGGVDLDCSICAGGVGRVPAGLAPARMGRGASKLGDYFAAAAHLEGASVHAFQILRRELAAHRAPAPLLRAARRARRDEVRHARVTARMARRFGGVPVPVRVAPVGLRPLAAVTVENAVEGCVRETFGALVASFQAARAGDPAIARAMEGIARDETRHAALSWAIARWAAGRLDVEARGCLRARCRDAIEALRREAGAGVDGELVARAGLPDAAQQRALLGVLEAQLWEGLSAA
jgi:hypothetical protein